MKITRQDRTAEHYRRLFEARPEAQIGYALAANAAYAARHGVCEAEHRHTPEWAALALEIRLRHSDHLSAADALAEMLSLSTPGSVPPTADPPLPTDPAADHAPAAGVWGRRAV